MLVDSPRLRPGDREHWALLEAADHLHARRYARSLRRRAAKAREAIRTFLARGPAYVSVSWGKDSMVVLDLALSVEPELPVVHILQGSAANPDDLLARDASFSRWALRYIQIDWPQDEEYTWRCWMTQIQQAAQHGGRITGIRAEESTVRRMSARVHGVSTARVCRPILWWSQQDVWAWFALRNLPVHPVYAMTAGGAYPRETLRVAGLIDYDQATSRGTEFGRAEWERMYYGPDVLRSFRSWYAPQPGDNVDREKGK